MRTLGRSAASAAIGFGVVLLATVLYDASEIARALGVDPAGGEAVVALGGLTLACCALAAGARALLRAPAPPAAS